MSPSIYIKVLKIGPGWKWQVLNKAGESIANSVEIRKTASLAAKEAGDFLALCTSNPVEFDCPSPGKAVEVLPGVYVWRKS